MEANVSVEFQVPDSISTETGMQVLLNFAQAAELKAKVNFLVCSGGTTITGKTNRRPRVFFNLTDLDQGLVRIKHALECTALLGP